MSTATYPTMSELLAYARKAAHEGHVALQATALFASGVTTQRERDKAYRQCGIMSDLCESFFERSFEELREALA